MLQAKTASSDDEKRSWSDINLHGMTIEDTEGSHMESRNLEDANMVLQSKPREVIVGTGRKLLFRPRSETKGCGNLTWSNRLVSNWDSTNKKDFLSLYLDTHMKVFTLSNTCRGF
jgi:hypothetical protein